MSLRPSEQAAHRRSSFKASVSAADGRRRRVSFMDGLRKEVRSGALRRKRCGGPDAVALEKMVGSSPLPVFVSSESDEV